MINLPEDPQSDLEFIAVRSHGVITDVVLTTVIFLTCYSFPVPGGTVTACVSVCNVINHFNIVPSRPDESQIITISKWKPTISHINFKNKSFYTLSILLEMPYYQKIQDEIFVCCSTCTNVLQESQCVVPVFSNK